MLLRFQFVPFAANADRDAGIPCGFLNAACNTDPPIGQPFDQVGHGIPLLFFRLAPVSQRGRDFVSGKSREAGNDLGENQSTKEADTAFQDEVEKHKCQRMEQKIQRKEEERLGLHRLMH